MACSDNNTALKALDFAFAGLEEGELPESGDLEVNETNSRSGLVGFYSEEAFRPDGNENGTEKDRMANLEEKVSRIEAFLGLNEARDHSSWVRSRGVTKEAMLRAIKEAIQSNRNNYGVSKHFIKKFVSEILGINVVGSQHYTKKMNVMLQHGIEQGLFVFSSSDQLFRLK